MLNKEQYITVVQKWKEEKEHTTEEHVIYNVLRAIDPSTGFAPIIRSNKLRSNESDPYNAFNSIAQRFSVIFREGYKYAEQEKAAYKATFGIEFTPEIELELSKLVHKV